MYILLLCLLLKIRWIDKKAIELVDTHLFTDQNQNELVLKLRISLKIK